MHIHPMDPMPQARACVTHRLTVAQPVEVAAQHVRTRCEESAASGGGAKECCYEPTWGRQRHA